MMYDLVTRAIQGNLNMEPIQVLHKLFQRTCYDIDKLRRTAPLANALAGQCGRNLWRFIDTKTVKSRLVATLTVL